MDEGEEKKDTLDFRVEIQDILETVGKWFESKMIHYSDEMFSDYFEHAKTRILTSETLYEYLKLRIDELIFKILSVYHDKKKDTTYQEVKEEEEELVPVWFLTERYAELDEMFTSKFLSYTFKEVDTEYDSVLKMFYVTLHLEKEIDQTSYEVLMKDIQSYLNNRITLLNFHGGKIIEPEKLEVSFGIDW